MPRTKKTLSKQNLSKIPVSIIDTGPESVYFNIKQLPGVFAGGKNAFLISGTSYLKPGQEILIELIDINGNSLYVEAIRGFVEANARLVVIEIYENTPPGAATLTIVGTARVNASTGIQLNDTESNVRWQKKIIIEPRNKNTTPLRLNKLPKLFIEEARTNVVNISRTTASLSRTFDFAPQIQNARQQGYLVSTTSSAYSAVHLNPKLTGSLSLETRKYTYDIPFTSSSYEITQTETSSVDLPLTLLNSTKATTSTNITGSITKNIINIKTIRSGSYVLSEAPQTASNGQSVTQIITSITSSVLYDYSQNTTTTITPEIESYVKIKLVDLGILSGQVYRIKSSFKLSNSANDNEYTFLADSPLIVAEILTTDTASIGGIVRDKWIGEFSDTVFTLRDNWYGNTLTGSSIPNESYYTSSFNTSSALTLFPRSNIILAGAFVSGSPNNCFFGTKENFEVFPNSEYTLKFTTVATASSNQDMTLDVYAVGTAVVYTDILGQKLGSLTVNQSSIAYFPDTQFNFSVLREGNIGLRFIPRSGHWQYSNISLKVAEEGGFSPDETTIYIPNKIIEDSIVSVKTELYDINNNAFDANIISLPTYFTGSRRYVLRSGDTMYDKLTVEQGGIEVTGSSTLTGSFNLVSGSEFYRWGNKLFNYGNFLSTASQAFPLANTAYSASLSTTIFNRGITIVSGSRITVQNDGHYNLQFSAQLENTANNTIIFDIWFAKNQVDIVNSATKVEITKQPSTTGKNVAAWNYMEYLTSGSYIEIRIAANQTSGQITYETANGVHPGVPSLIVTVDQIA